MGYSPILDALKIIGGTTAAMLAAYFLLYSGSVRPPGRSWWLSPRVALIGAIVAGLLVLGFALLVWLRS